MFRQIKTKNGNFIYCSVPADSRVSCANIFYLPRVVLDICSFLHCHVLGMVQNVPSVPPRSRATNLRSSVRPCSPQCVQMPKLINSMMSHWHASRHQCVSFGDFTPVRKTKHIKKCFTSWGIKCQWTILVSHSITKILVLLTCRKHDRIKFS